MNESTSFSSNLFRQKGAKIIWKYETFLAPRYRILKGSVAFCPDWELTLRCVWVAARAAEAKGADLRWLSRKKQFPMLPPSIAAKYDDNTEGPSKCFSIGWICYFWILTVFYGKVANPKNVHKQMAKTGVFMEIPAQRNPKQSGISITFSRKGRELVFIVICYFLWGAF